MSPEANSTPPVSRPPDSPEQVEAKRLRRQYWFAGIAGAVLLFFVLPFTYAYVKLSRQVDEKLRSGPFASASNFFAAPRTLVPGAEISEAEITSALRRAGYSDRKDDNFGWYRLSGGEIEIHPGEKAVLQKEPARIRLAKGKISSIYLDNAKRDAPQYSLEPELLTNFTDGSRERRRMVRFEEIPKVLVNALVSAEDKRFFDHSGLDMRRILKAAYVDFKDRRKEQGASTITMQLARGIWLEPQKAWKRKLTEILITMQLEQKLSKQQILEYYCNLIYLGRRDTFSIHGFGEASQTFFNRDIGELTLPQAATLAGMVQRPTYFNPFKYPARATARRNVILSLMRQNGYISAKEQEEASGAPLGLSPRILDAGGAPYFLALVNDELQSRLSDSAKEGEAYQVFTTLDWDLQRAAQKAVELGMAGIDKLIRQKRKKNDPDTALPQVALIALDPHTGYIKAVVGGRNYALSQLNHALSKRQPGSVFKPFVYAAALNTAVEGSRGKIITAANTLDDSPTTFKFNNQIYEPGNFKQNYHGTVTLRRALASSMNIATVHLAEQVGYDNVVKLARKFGLNEDIQPTPAVALGAYEATPLEIAGAYTVFANGGVFVEPTFLASVQSRDGKIVAAGSPERHPALDPRVNYMMVNLLEEVMRSGTAAGVRGKGFRAPAAGKTGTSRDGWFAGFTSDLLCVVWVGFDDNRELDLEGSKSALPIWTEFMKRAVALGTPTKPFEKVKGIVSVNIDPDTGLLASDLCGPGRAENFIAGTQPKSACESKPFPGDPSDPDVWQTPSVYRPN